MNSSFASVGSRCLRRAALFLVVVLGDKAPFAWSAQRTVLLEKFAATWCPHCMAASPAVDRLLADYPNLFIPIDVFASPSGRYSQPWGLSRAFDFYGLTSYPTAWLDGVVKRIGSADAYSSYLSSIANRSSIPTDLTIGLGATHKGGRDYDITLSVSLESGAAAKPVQIYLVQAIDHYGIYDDMTTVPRNTLWKVLASGLDVSLSPGQSRQLSAPLALDDVSWSRFADVKLIAWAQAPAMNGPAEVYNATQLALPPLLSGDFNRNGMVEGGDFLVWQRGGSPNANSAGDLAAWQATFGLAAAVPAISLTNAAVPEPRAWALCVVASLALQRTRRKRSSTRSPRHHWPCASGAMTGCLQPKPIPPLGPKP